MTDQPTVNPETPDVPQSGLRRPLTDDEQQLLRLIFEPFYGPSVEWPTWFYVSQRFYQQWRQVPEEVLAGLPTVRVGSRSSYGLVWWESGTLPEPNQGETVALSVAGLLAVGTPAAADVARFLVQTAQSLGRAFAGYPVDPRTTGVEAMPLAVPGNGRINAEGMAIGFPVTAAWGILRREPLMPDAWPAIDDQWVARPGVQDRRLIGVSTPAEYLDLVENEASSASMPAPSAHPLSLVSTLDYFATVARLPPLRWPSLTGSAPLADAAQVTLPVQTREDFSDRVSALSRLLDLKVPEATREELTRWRWPERDPAPGSLHRLRLHLMDRAGGEDVAAAPIGTLQAIRRVRASMQHTTDVAGARRAYTRLQLPYPVRDWSAAWIRVQHEAIRAIDGLREAVQGLPVDA